MTQTGNFLFIDPQTPGVTNQWVGNGTYDIPNENIIVWEQTVNVIPGTDYLFSMWHYNGHLKGHEKNRTKCVYDKFSCTYIFVPILGFSHLLYYFLNSFAKQLLFQKLLRILEY